MTYTLELPPVFEEIAIRRAQKDGKNEMLKTGADLLALWEREGVFLPHEDMPDSPAYARQIREMSQEAREH